MVQLIFMDSSNCNHHEMIDSCDCCDRTFHDIRDYSYKMNQHLLDQLPLSSDIRSNIAQYLFHDVDHFDHTIVYHKKVRKETLEYYDFENDSDDEDIFTIIEKNIKICSLCFVVSLEYSLQIQQRLPYLRRDHVLFVWNKRDDLIDIDVIKSIKDNFSFNLRDEYILPKLYYCTYYRQELPENKNGKKEISLFQ